MKFKAFIFDLDGTLLDSLKDLVDSVNYALKIQGCNTISEEAIQNFGDSMNDIIECIIPKEKKQDKPWIAETLSLIVKEYNKSWRSHTCLYPGVDKILDILSLKNIPMAIISNKPEPFLLETVSYFLKKWDFVKVIGSRGGYPEKPNPLSTLEMIKCFDLAKEEIAFVGDGVSDIETARSAEISSISVTWGYRDITDLRGANPDFEIATPEELLHYL